MSASPAHLDVDCDTLFQRGWTVYHGRVYDVSCFIPHHPGGSFLIRLAQGIDCTALIESYHPLTSIDRVQRTLEQKCQLIGRYSEPGNCSCNDESDKNIRCEHRADDTFYRTVRQRVETYLREKHGSKEPHRTYAGWIQLEAIGTLIGYLGATYYTSVYGSYAAAMLLGFFTGRMGLVMHSGNHASVSKWPVFNRLVGMFMDVVGANSWGWAYEHQVAHHITPNEHKKDNDCEIAYALLRFHPLLEHADDIYQKDLMHQQALAKNKSKATAAGSPDSVPAPTSNMNPNGGALYRFTMHYQHIMTPLFMSVGFFKWFFNDFQNFWNSRIGNVRIQVKPADWLMMIGAKLLWLIMHVVVPWHLHGLKVTLITVIIFMVVGAQYLENIFIVNHIQEDCQEVLSAIDKQKRLTGGRPLHWAQQQVCATTNWASRSVLWNFMSGGLNHQIEHHLFPAMNTLLYPSISPIVQRTCEEFGMPYRNYSTWFESWIAMLHYLRKLGNPDSIMNKLAKIE